MITPLKKHRGQNGGLAALAVLAIATVGIWATHVRREAPAEEPPRPRAVTAKVAPAPPPVPVTVAPEPSAIVGYDENATAHVQTFVAGWIRTVHARSRGRKIRRGEPLAMLYSPEVYAAELALVAEARNFTTQEALSAARRKLTRWGMSKEMIERVEKTGEPRGMLPLWAWRDGTLVANHALPGLYVEASRELFTITDPSHLWILAELPAVDAARAGVGTPVKLAIDGHAKPVIAKIVHVYPVAYDGTRMVRFELANPPPTIRVGATVRIELVRAES